MNMQSARNQEQKIDQGNITFDSIMKEYGQSVLWLAYSYVKDKSLAEDITQEVFISCYKNLDAFRGDSSIKTWLYRITGNRCKDVLKSWSYRSRKITGALFDDHRSDGDSPEAAVLKKMEDRELSVRVLSLPVKYREVIYLYYFEEYSIDQISTLLSISAGTVKTRLHRGRKLLKDMYERGDSLGR
ncbi:sigma-70 family RNA polymerase sigma factor [Peribacillus sp. SCS-37]|uniref:sigma-70 family RNA polymerase sigma factor n=1 Tax=Paraperibacillus esterisolvens TaxID=3115296 RepID=UPI0039063CFA